MKKIIILSTLFVFTFLACNSTKTNDSKDSEISVIAADDQIYACSTDPEIHGKKGEKCSKCGMELTEKVEMKSDSLK